MLLASLLLAGCRAGVRSDSGAGFRFGNQVPSPDPEVAALAPPATLTDEGREIFFAASPQLRARAGFTLSCPVKERRQILGCYINGRIFILRIDDPELAPVMLVTAAHEMLHAAYEQLSGRERREVDELTTTFYRNTTDAELKEIVERYPAEDHLNELHSLVGTQVASLPNQLEEYYSRYFRNRSDVVRAHAESDAVFDRIETRYDQLLAEIHELAAEIDRLIPRQEQQVARAESLSSQIETLRSQDRIEESNLLVPQQNRAADEATRLQARIVLLTNDHNAKVREINDLVFRQDELIKSLSPV